VWQFVLLFTPREAAVVRPRLRRVVVAERLALRKPALVETLVAQRALRVLRTRDRTPF
jgi:hypothetical protein